MNVFETRDWDERKEAKFSDLVGKRIKHVEYDQDGVLVFITDEGDVYQMYHDQDCCESVTLEDFELGEARKILEGHVVGIADESSSSDLPPLPSSYDGGWDNPDRNKYTPDSYTWTFYKLATDAGWLDIRWYGESNGYYSESVDFYLLNEKYDE
jgi:hypothetical protein